MADRDRIQDIPSLKKPRQQLETSKGDVANMSMLGVVERIQNDFQKRNETIERDLINIETISDRFNDIFANRGWIMYESMSIEVADAAIKMAESDNIDSAEIYLADYYTEEIIKSKIKRMKDIRAFRPRWELAQKALNDYLEGRYYACVHVVQSILDGMVSEIYLKAYGHHKGFYTEGIDLTAWDSISAHSKGLTLLAKNLCKSRKTTRTERIITPYRHGIVHGTDLNYDNKIAAAKIWAALFATCNWAMKAENGKLKEPLSSEKPITWDEVMRQIAANAEAQAKLSEWKPRVMTIGKDIPATGLSDIYAESTPERALAEYLSYWVNDRFDKMRKYIPVKFSKDRLSARDMRIRYDNEHLRSWEFIEIKDTAVARTEITAKLNFNEADRTTREITEHVFFMINYTSDGGIAFRDDPGSKWIVFNWDWINFQ